MRRAARRERVVLLGLGANLDRPLDRLRRAGRMLARELTGVRASAVYRTPPEGDAQQPNYLNAVVRGRTSLEPQEILALALKLEADAGRSRPYPGAPRTLDVDVLFVGDVVLSAEELTVPHPRWATRDFVVVPLMDVASEWRDPLTGLTVAQVASAKGWSPDRFELVLEAGALTEEGAG